MTMNKDLENISKILRDHLHLTAEEVEGFLAGSLDSESTRVIEEHLHRCHLCAKEVDIIREIDSEPEPGSGGLLSRLDLRKVLPLTQGARKQYDRFWLADEDYPLTTMKEYPDLLEVEGLYLPELLGLRREDRNDPGSVPIAVEAHGRQPIVAALSSFEAAGDFYEPSEDNGSTAADVAEDGMRFFAPVLEAGAISPPSDVLRMAKHLRVLSGRGKRKKRPKPNPILRCRAKDHDIELFHDGESDRIFLNIQARKDGKG